MEIYQYKSENHIGLDIQSHFFTVDSLKYASGIHYHDYYEVFLVTKGSAIHVINGERHPLSEGSLVIIRPEDIHYYEYHGKEDCKFINICYKKDVIDKVLAFIGEEFNPYRLTSSKLPPHTLLSSYDLENLIHRLDKISLLTVNNNNLRDMQLRGLLVNILLQYFNQLQKEEESTLPLWMENLLVEMQKKDNFTLGVSKMYEISGVSQGHLNRVFRENLNTTPIEYINSLRFNYVKYLLLTTNFSITEIAFEAGFNNLSHFYHLFKRNFSMSPLEFRKSKRGYAKI